MTTQIQKREIGKLESFGKYFTVQYPMAKVIHYDYFEALKASRELKEQFK